MPANIEIVRIMFAAISRIVTLSPSQGFEYILVNRLAITTH